MTCDVEKTSSSGNDLFGCFGKLICEGIPHQDICDKPGWGLMLSEMVPFLWDAFVHVRYFFVIYHHSFRADIDSEV